MPSEAANGSGPRYAPEDPTLPEPWKGLVDGNTGYLYYWNPVTNVTQYEKPVKEKLPGPPPLLKKSVVSSYVHREEQSYGQDGRSRSHQYDGGRPSGSLSLHGSGDSEHGNGNSIPGSRTSAKDHGPSDATGGLSSEAYRRQNEITIIGDDVPPPYMTFESTGFPLDILKEVRRAGFTAPTPIQAQSWPIALQSHDIVAIAKTGSGKTLGYLIPGFIHLKRLRNNPRMGPTVLVLAPTRELATQIQVEADKFGRSSKIACTCVYGGAPKGPQLRDLDRGVDVVVATPGRLNDILEMKRVNFRQVSYLVLDEADRMLDMGFEPQIRKIVKEIPHRHQTLMFTATWPKEVRKIAADLLLDPVQVNIGSINELVANKAITQYVEVIKPIEKQRRLEQILRSQEPGSKVIIFCSTKRMCDQLARTLARQFGAVAIHGDKNQSERDRVLGHFRTGRCPILVATDVAARGLDIKDIRVVINFDFPTGVEDYVHRIGRTGRAGATGVSYTLFGDQDSKYALELVKVLEGAGQCVPSQLRDMVSRGGYGGRSRRWASGPRDLGRANGKGHGDSGYGGRGGRGLPPSRSDSDRGVRRDSGDRYDRNHDYENRHNEETRGCQDPKVIPRGRVRSPSHSHSLSPRADAKGRHDSKAISRVQVHSQSSSRSLSPSPKRARVGWGPKGSKSRSRSRRLDWPGKPMILHGRSSVSKKREPLVDDGHFRDQSRRSPRSPVSYDDGEIRDDHQLDRSPHPRSGRSRTPILSGDDRVLDRLAHPRMERSRSPIRSGDERLDRTPHSRNVRSRSPIQSRDDRLDHSPYSRNERALSPIQSRDDQLGRLPRPRMARSQSPCADNGKRGGSLNGAERPSIDKAVRSQPLAYDGDEEEEGMILPDEEGMIHPDEDMISPKGKEPNSNY